MTNKTVEAISIKLNAVFGDEYTAYTEDITQGLALPCFHIQPISAATQQFQGGRKRLLRPFDVKYYPVSETAPTAEINAVMERLLAELEYINAEDGLLRGTGMHWEIVDGIGHFLVDYNILVQPVRPKKEPMAALEQNAIIREEVETDA